MTRIHRRDAVPYTGDAYKNGTSWGHLLFAQTADVSQARPKKMQSQMQSQTKNNTTTPSILLKIMVSRAGLEPATTALKVRLERYELQFHSENMGFQISPTALRCTE